MATVLHILLPHFLKLPQTLDTLDVDKVATQGSAPNFDTVADAVKTMATMLADEPVQAAGCTFLADFHRKTNRHSTDKLTTLQEINVIVAALHAHRSSVDVQHQGCRALLNITCNDNNKVRVAKRDGIETILAAMKTHRSSENVQQYGCRALVNLAFSPNNQVTIAAGAALKRL